jgi:hypothetical protein
MRVKNVLSGYGIAGMSLGLGGDDIQELLGYAK